MRERNSAIIKEKKRAVLEATGRLACQACGFDFLSAYGELGEGFCEVHHIAPLSETQDIVQTTLEDLAALCSNCHRMIHRSDPMLTVDELAELVWISADTESSPFRRLRGSASEKLTTDEIMRQTRFIQD